MNHKLEIAELQIGSAQTSSRNRELYANNTQIRRQNKEIWPVSENSQYRIS